MFANSGLCALTPARRTWSDAMRTDAKESMDVEVSESQSKMRTHLVQLATECALDEALRIYVFSRFSCDIEALGDHDLAEVSDLFLPIIIDMKSQLSQMKLQ